LSSDADWLTGQRKRLLEYLATELPDHGPVPDFPDWYVSPYVAVWRVGSVRAPRMVGWWAITGDVPTDYTSSAGIATARDAMRHFGSTWTVAAQRLEHGEGDPELRVGSDSPDLASPLQSRAEMLLQLAEADENW
jgi:hypothetical protein